MGRDKGKGRGGGGGRGRGGGSRMFIENEDELEIRNTLIEISKEERRERRQDDDDDEDDGDDKSKMKSAATVPDTVFSMGKVAQSLGAVEGEGAAAVDSEFAGLNRKQREALEEIKRKEEYMKRHLAGETEQAKKDLERLAAIRKKREADAKKREAEGRAPGMSKSGLPSDDEEDDDDDDDDDDEEEGAKAKAKAAPAPMSAVQLKKRAAAAGEAPPTAAPGTSSASGAGAPKPEATGPAKLKAMDIKKMNGDALKDALKERGLEIQGQKKDLIQRLLDYEAQRS